MDTKNKKRKKTRSKILLQVTLGVILVFVVSTVLGWVVYLRSVDKIVNESKANLITEEAAIISSAYDFIAEYFALSFSESVNSSEALADFKTAITEKKETEIITASNTASKELAETETMGINTYITVMIASPPTVPESIVLQGSEDDLLFNDVPKDIEDVIESGEGYRLLENGVPEWGIEDEQLLVIYDVGKNIYGGAVPFYTLGFKPMHDEIAAINDFYSKQKRNVNMTVSIVIACSLVILTLLTLFWLRFLISSKITKPIEELECAAEKVIEGDLDVEVPVREGEEFVNLKKAFNGMIISIRDIINRATGG